MDLKNTNDNLGKKVLVLSVNQYDSTEVLGVFDDVEKLRQTCYEIIRTEETLQDDIENLHIYECTLNHMFAEFYPLDYDDPDSVGWYLEKQDDLCAEILGADFIQEMQEREEST